MAPQKLDPQALQNHLDRVDGDWSILQGKLHRDLVFGDFVAAFAFMTRVADAAEELGHHPEWFNVYNRVSIDLSTHDAGGAVTEKDFELARRIDQLVEG